MKCELYPTQYRGYICVENSIKKDSIKLSLRSSELGDLYDWEASSGISRFDFSPWNSGGCPKSVVEKNASLIYTIQKLESNLF